MRLFTAIEVSEETRESLARITPRLGLAGGKGLKFVRPENLHVTSKFLGEVADDRVQALSTAFERQLVACIGPLCVDRAELLPPRGKVRVIAVGLGGDHAAVRGLFRSIEDIATQFGIAKESRDFRAHVTLARARDPLPGSSRQHLSDIIAANLPGPQFVPTDYTLFKSDLKPGGPVYTPVARFPLTLV